MPIIRYIFLGLFICHSAGVLFAAEEVCELDSNEESGPIVLTLKQGINRAMTANRQLAGAAESLEKSCLSLEFAETDFEWHIVPRGQAGYIGGGSAGSGATIGTGVDFYKKFSYGTKFDLNPSVTKDADHFHTNVYFKISQPLLRGFGEEYTLSGLRGAQYSYRSTVRSLYMAQVSTILRTITTMYEVVKQQQSMKFNQDSFDRLSKMVKAVKMKEKIGLADGLDVYRANAEFKQAEDALTTSIERYQEALDILRDFLAYPLDKPLEVNLPLKYHEISMNVDEAIDKALVNRIEIDQVEDQLSESIRISRVAEKNLLPDLRVVVDYTNTGKAEVFTKSLTWRDRESRWGIGFTTSSDFAMEAEKIAFAQSQIGVDATERIVDQTRDNVILDVKRAIRQLARVLKRIHLQEEQVKNSQGEFYLSQIKFDRGMANNFDMIQAEKSLRNNENSLMNAIIEHIVGEFQLHASLGLLLEKPTF